MENPTEINLIVKIVNISLEEFYVHEKLPVDVAKSLDKANIQFEFNASANIDISKKLINISLKTNFFAEIEKKNNIGHIYSSGSFDIANLEDIIEKNEGKLANAVLANFIGVTLSTTRGFLILKSEGTYMSGVIMPMMNPMGFFPGNEKLAEQAK